MEESTAPPLSKAPSALHDFLMSYNGNALLSHNSALFRMEAAVPVDWSNLSDTVIVPPLALEVVNHPPPMGKELHTETIISTPATACATLRERHGEYHAEASHVLSNLERSVCLRGASKVVQLSTMRRKEYHFVAVEDESSGLNHNNVKQYMLDELFFDDYDSLEEDQGQRNIAQRREAEAARSRAKFASALREDWEEAPLVNAEHHPGAVWPSDLCPHYIGPERPWVAKGHHLEEPSSSSSSSSSSSLSSSLSNDNNNFSSSPSSPPSIDTSFSDSSPGRGQNGRGRVPSVFGYVDRYVPMGGLDVEYIRLLCEIREATDRAKCVTHPCFLLYACFPGWLCCHQDGEPLPAWEPSSMAANKERKWLCCGPNVTPAFVEEAFERGTLPYLLGGRPQRRAKTQPRRMVPAPQQESAQTQAAQDCKEEKEYKEEKESKESCSSVDLATQSIGSMFCSCPSCVWPGSLKMTSDAGVGVGAGAVANGPNAHPNRSTSQKSNDVAIAIAEPWSSASSSPQAQVAPVELDALAGRNHRPEDTSCSTTTHREKRASLHQERKGDGGNGAIEITMPSPWLSSQPNAFAANSHSQASNLSDPFAHMDPEKDIFVPVARGGRRGCCTPRWFCFQCSRLCLAFSCHCNGTFLHPELSLGYVYDSSLPEPRVDDLVALQCVEVNIEPLLYTAAFLDLSPHMLEKLVRRGNLLVDEFLLFQACVRWARTRLWRRGEAHTDRVAIRAELCGGPGAKKEEGKKQDLPVNILSYIRFPAMQSVEIERVARTGLLAPSEMERVWTWKYTSGRQLAQGYFFPLSTQKMDPLITRDLRTDNRANIAAVNEKCERVEIGEIDELYLKWDPLKGDNIAVDDNATAFSMFMETLRATPPQPVPYYNNYVVPTSTKPSSSRHATVPAATVSTSTSTAATISVITPSTSTSTSTSSSSSSPSPLHSSSLITPSRRDEVLLTAHAKGVASTATISAGTRDISGGDMAAGINRSEVLHMSPYYLGAEAVNEHARGAARVEAAIAQGHVGAWSAEARTEANQTLRRSGGQQLGIRAENVFYNTTWRSRGIARVFGFLQSLPAGFSLLSLAVLPWVLMGFEQQSRSFYSLSVYFWFAGIALPILFALVGAYLTLFAHCFIRPYSSESRLKDALGRWCLPLDDMKDRGWIPEVLNLLRSYAGCLAVAHVLALVIPFLLFFLKFASLYEPPLYAFFVPLYFVVGLSLLYPCRPSDRRCCEPALVAIAWVFIAQFFIVFLLAHLKLSGYADYSMNVVFSPFYLSAAIILVLSIVVWKEGDFDALFSLCYFVSALIIFIVFLGFYFQGFSTPDQKFNPSISVTLIPIYGALATFSFAGIYAFFAICGQGCRAIHFQKPKSLAALHAYKWEVEA